MGVQLTSDTGDELADADQPVVVLVEELEDALEFLLGQLLSVLSQTPPSRILLETAVDRVPVKKLNEISNTVNASRRNLASDLVQNLVRRFPLHVEARLHVHGGGTSLNCDF